MLRAAASLVAPPLCALCADPCDYADSICRMCERKVARLYPVRDEIGGLEIWSAARYDGVAREIVTKMKFAQRLTLAEVAAERMIRTVGAGRDRLLRAGPAIACTPARTGLRPRLRARAARHP